MNRKKLSFKRTLACLLVVIMTLSAVPMSGFVGLELPKWSQLFATKASALSSSGKCGENVTYTYNSETGEVIINGTGKMEDYTGYHADEYNSPFLYSNIESVIIEDGVTSIGDCVFEYCSSLTNITIPDSVTSIGEIAFGYCDSLTNIIIPDGVKRIGSSAFFCCSGLGSVTIGISVTSIGYHAFERCTGLTKINWNAERVNDYVDNVFRDAGVSGDGIEVVFGDNVMAIPDDVFYVSINSDRPKIKSVTIGNSATSIGSSAFRGCSSLSSITIPENVTSIGYDAFSDTAWYNAQPFGDVYAGKVYYKYKGTMPPNTNVVIKEGTKGIADGAFKDCTGLTSITIPDSVIRIEYGAFSDTAWYKAQPFGDVYAGKVYYKYKGTMLPNTSVVIKEGTKGIAGGAFEDCAGLTDITIPNSVTSIGDKAFYYCTNLDKRLTIGNRVTSIGDEAFYHCTQLDSVTIGNRVTSIGDKAFYYCTQLDSVTIGSAVRSIGNYAFLNCNDLTEINWNAESVRDFSSNSGMFHYYGTEGIDVVFGDGVKTIPDYVFYSDFEPPKLKSVTIGNSVTDIGVSAFENCWGFSSITIPDSVTSIGSSAFSCTNLESVTIPDSVKSIGNEAFYNCDDLKRVTIGNGVETIGMRAFSGCPLTTIKIGKNTKTIEEDAFKGIKEIPEVYFAGSEEEWKNISIDQSNDMILRANMHYNTDITHTHSYTSKITKAATCIADGVRTYTCSCGDKYTKPIAKTGHKLVTDKAVAATCTKTGKTEGKHCSVCGTVTVAQKTVAKKAHTYKTTTTKATIAKDGKTVTACTVCGFVSKTTPIYKASSIKLSGTSYVYNAKVQRPTVTIKNSKGSTLKNGTDYTVSYSSGCKNPGKYAVKVTFKGNYTGSKTLYFTILPGVTSSIATTTNSSAIKLTWKAVPGATGYRVFQYDAKTKKYVTVKTLTGTSCTVSKLKSGTTYKFAVRAYSTVNGTVYWASGYKTVTATTNPGTPTLTVTAGAKKATLKWTKRAEATGYVVYMATSKTGKYTKIATIKNNSTVSMTKTGLTTGKTYYFKVAAYKTVGGKNIYSSYSSVKYVKIK